MTGVQTCALPICYASGVPDNRFEESSEDIQVVLADKKEVRRILKEENVAMMCAYMLLHFLKSEGDPLGFVEMKDK